MFYRLCLQIKGHDGLQPMKELTAFYGPEFERVTNQES